MGPRNYAYHHPSGAPIAKGEGEDAAESPCVSLSCLKFVVYMYTLFSLATALTVAGLSLWIIIDTDQVLALYSDAYMVLARIVLAVSLLIVLITVVGCCGISRESHGLMFVYAAFCGIVVLFQLSGGIAAYVYRADIQDQLVQELNKTISQDYGMNNETTQAVDFLQTRLECCGANSFEDWNTTQWLSRGFNQNNLVPDSCCKTVSRLCGVRDHPSNIYYTGCGERLSSLGSNNLLLIGTAAIAVAIIQIFGLVVSIQLGLTMKKFENS